MHHATTVIQMTNIVIFFFNNELSSIINNVDETDELIMKEDYNGRVGERKPPWEW